MHNALLFIENGQIIYRYYKQLLPVYSVFNEARHFQPGTQPGLFEWKCKHLGFLICEDGWEDHENPLYQRDPVAQLENNELDLVISINASPCNIRKHQARYDVIKSIAQRCQADTVYVNQVGAIDGLVFDGGSTLFKANGECVIIAPFYQETVFNVDTEQLPQEKPITFPRSIALIAEQLKLGLKDYCAKCGFKQVVVGSSGGIDSAVTLAIAAWALGPENVIAITMPSEYSSEGSVDDSQSLCDRLGIQLLHAPIGETFNTELVAYEKAFGEPASPLAQENLQARIRGQRLMTYSNSTGAMVVSTGNKTEMSVGYCTLYGDMAGGVSLLGDVYKLQVYALATYLNEVVFEKEAIPVEIIDKAPSAELAPDQKDTDSLPPYDQLDAILKLFLEDDLIDVEEKNRLDKIVSDIPNEIIIKVKKMVDRNEYKRRQAAPVIRVNRRAFGVDRQIPITAKLEN